MTEVEAALRGINAAASIVRTQRSVVDLRHVLDVDTLSRSGSRRVLPPPRAASPPGRAFARGAEALLSGAHDARVATVSLSSSSCIDEQRLRDWLVRPSRSPFITITPSRRVMRAGGAAVGAREQCRLR